MQQINRLLEPLPPQPQIQYQIVFDPPVILEIKGQVGFLKRKTRIAESEESCLGIVRDEIIESRK